MVQHSYAGLLEAVTSLSKGAAEIQILNVLSRNHRITEIWGQQTNHNTWHWHCNARLHNQNKCVVSLLLYILQFGYLEFTKVNFSIVFAKQACFFGSTSPAEEREFTFATCVPARARLQVVGSACIPQDSPWAKEFFLQFLAIPKATPPMFSWEWCTVSLNSPWLPGAAQKASQPPTHQELPFAPGVAPPAQDSGASSRGTRGMHLLGKKEWAWKENTSFKKARHNLRDHPSNLYSFLCCFTFPSAKKYIYIGPRFTPDMNPLTANVTLGINLAHHV